MQLQSRQTDEHIKATEYIKFTTMTLIKDDVLTGGTGGRRHRPGPGSFFGGLWTPGLQDRLVRTMAAIISSISTDSGLRKLDAAHKEKSPLDSPV